MTNLTLNTPMADPEKAQKLEWKRPDQVMQLHRLKVKKRALQARINNTYVSRENLQLESVDAPKECNSDSNQCVGQKRKNPFAKDDVNKRPNVTPSDLEASNDNTLFELLKIDAPKAEKLESSVLGCSLTFSDVLSKLEVNKNIPNPEAPRGEKFIPIDWTLKTKMRFMSSKPFPWNCKLKTSEEASGTTGFVRCLDISEQHSTLDTSPNAR